MSDRPSNEVLHDLMDRFPHSDLCYAAQVVMFGLKYDGRNRSWYERSLDIVNEHLRAERELAAGVAFRTPTRAEKDSIVVDTDPGDEDPS